MTINYLILNFEGVDGSSDIVESGQSLEPANIYQCEIDTAQYNSGGSSLLCVPNESNILSYTLPSFPSRFKYISYFRYSSLSGLNWFDLFNSIAISGYGRFKITVVKQSGIVQLSAYGLDCDNNQIGTYGSVAPVSAPENTWNKMEFILSGKLLTVKVNDVVAFSLTALADDPLKNLTDVDVFTGSGMNSCDIWIDDVSMASEGVILPAAAVNLSGLAPAYNVYNIPHAALTLIGYDPYRHEIVPSADVQLLPWPISIKYAYNIPSAAVSIAAVNPSSIWEIPASLSGSAQAVYRCILTGSNNGLADIEIPLESFQGWMRDVYNSYLSCEIPWPRTSSDYITSRGAGEIIIYGGFRFADGTEQLEEIIRVDYDSLQVNKGARSGSMTMSGYKALSASAVKERTVSGISYYGKLSTGKRVIKADLDIFLRCSDICIYGSGINDYFTVGHIKYTVKALPAAVNMEVTEQ